MPINLALIIICQVVIFGIISFLPQTSRLNRIQWVIAAVTGTFFGISMDIVLGTLGIFAYLPDGIQSTAVASHNLETDLLVVNAVASYGLAIATTALVSKSFISNKEISQSWLLVTCSVFFIGVIGISLSAKTSMTLMFSCGLVVIASGEMFLFLDNRVGPIIALLSRTSHLPFLKLWAFSIVVGTGYEIANWIFPFWIWLPDSNIAKLWTEIIIVFLGYFVLFHGMTTIWVLSGFKRE